MARNVIVVSSDPKGHFIEGVIAAGNTPKPGTCMTLMSDGLYEVWNGAADGERGNEIIVLREDSLRGKTVDDAYAAGERAFMYIPVTGDELMMLCANISGTGDTYAFASKLIIDDGTGKLIATTGSPESEPFRVIEAPAAALTADTLVLCRFNGQ